MPSVITQTITPITPLGDFLSENRPAEVDNLVENELPQLTNELIALIPQINEAKDLMSADLSITSTASLIAQGAANYQGDWVSQGYTLGQSVTTSGVFYVCKLTHTSGQNPTDIDSLYWVENIAAGIQTQLNDRYTKSETYNKTEVYNKTETYAKTEVYTKTEIDALLRALIPTGIITKWSGSVASIPAGWYLCNGANGTVNLVDRFVVGAGSSYAVGVTGGNRNAVVVHHSHSAWTDVQGEHTHAYNYYDQNYQASVSGNGSISNIGGISGVANPNANIKSAGSHGHNVGVSGSGEDGTNKNLPPYYALCFIQKVW